jgi:hypothetical protein
MQVESKPEARRNLDQRRDLAEKAGLSAASAGNPAIDFVTVDDIRAVRFAARDRPCGVERIILVWLYRIQRPSGGIAALH